MDIALGVGMGTALPAPGQVFEALLWPGLEFLLYTAFVPVLLPHLREAFADHRFITALWWVILSSCRSPYGAYHVAAMRKPNGDARS